MQLRASRTTIVNLIREFRLDPLIEDATIHGYIDDLAMTLHRERSRDMPCVAIPTKGLEQRLSSEGVALNP